MMKLCDVTPMRAAIRICAVVLVAAACAAPQQDVAAPDSRRAMPATNNLSQRCTNTHHGFSVSYPAGWTANDGEVMPACSTFDAKPFKLPPQSEIPFDVDVVISVEDVPMQRVIESSQWERVLSSERLTIGGRDAYRVEVESTGEGLADRGMRTLRYAIDLGGGRTVIASTHDADPAYEQNQRVLAEMVQSLTFDQPRN